MKRSLTTGVIACVIALVALPCLHYSTRAQDRPEGYWEFQKAEIFGMDKDNKEILSRRSFDVKQRTGVNGHFRGDAQGVREWYMDLYPKDLPKIIKTDEGSATITGSVYAEVTEANGWPDFVKFGINYDLETASGDTWSGIGGDSPGYRYITKLGQPRAEASFSTAGLLLPKTGEDFTVRVMVRATNEATTAYKNADTYTYLFHYKWMGSTADTTDDPSSGCFAADPGARSKDRNGHYDWAQSQDSATLARNLNNKTALLFRCSSIGDDKLSGAFADISVIIARYVPKPDCFNGDRGAISEDWSQHKSWGAGKGKSVMLDNLEKKTTAALQCLDRSQQNSFFADVSVIIANAATQR